MRQKPKNVSPPHSNIPPPGFGSLLSQSPGKGRGERAPNKRDSSPGIRTATAPALSFIQNALHGNQSVDQQVRYHDLSSANLPIQPQPFAKRNPLNNLLC